MIASSTSALVGELGLISDALDDLGPDIDREYDRLMAATGPMSTLGLGDSNSNGRPEELMNSVTHHEDRPPQRKMHVSSAYDPGRTWQEMVEQLSKGAPGSEAPEFLNALFASMQQQFEVLQQAFEKQAAFQRDLAERALGPMKQMFTELQKAAETTRAAGEALQHAGDMLTQQAAAMNQALSLAQPFVETAFPPKPASAKQY